MPKILINVRESQKELWVAAAHDERVSLSEWIRRRCDGGLTAGAEAVDVGQYPMPAPRVAASEAVAPAVSSPKRCVRFQRHHVNHSGAPCPECGYPNEGGEK